MLLLRRPEGRTPRSTHCRMCRSPKKTKSTPARLASLCSAPALTPSALLIPCCSAPKRSQMRQLESLDLSSNELSGEIPEELASLNFLSTLNLSYNKLAGRMPESSQFSIFSRSSFLGNTSLCGPPVSKQCSNRTETNALHALDNDFEDVLLFMFTALGFGIFFSITVVVIWGRHSRK